ncbi:glucosidase II [Dimargaris verticillata]|uniref:Glucosidase II subunit alpha n=1 Tax=Dimargaris verticillata TaxID=2761393 RepID=A0A9W8B497_9FUNG|nr:glucosidase II [Dimargaris verticillata]
MAGKRVALLGLLLALLPHLVAGVKKEDFKKCNDISFCRRNRAYADLIRANYRGSSSGTAHLASTEDQGEHVDSAAADVLASSSVRSAPSSFDPPYVLQPTTTTLDQGVFKADVINTQFNTPLQLTLDLLTTGVARVRLTEAKPLRSRYNGLDDLVLIPNALPRDAKASFTTQSMGDGKVIEITYGYASMPNDANSSTDHRPAYAHHVVRIHSHPLRLNFYGVRSDPGADSEEVLLLEVNGEGFLNMEHYRSKADDEMFVKAFASDTDNATSSTSTAFHSALQPLADPDGRWDEKFKSWTDSKPHGPASVAVDLAFPGFEHVYGIPEHASTLSLKTTRGPEAAYSEPYRLYNLDVFEYITDSPMALYGAIPVMMAHRPNCTAGVFWLNAAETWVDIEKYAEPMDAEDQKSPSRWAQWLAAASSHAAATTMTTTSTHWMSEAGTLDFFVLTGGTSPAAVLKQYGQLTGTSALPPMFSIAHHQCRWNYVDQADVLDVNANFDVYDIPYDVIWLDIEHTDHKKYFTWDKDNFPEPKAMQQTLGATGRQLVTIVDPHIKKDTAYYVSEEARRHGYFIKKADGASDFEGWCWPGNSQYVDYANPAAVEWWARQFRYDQYQGSTRNLFIWNDMNEPSVFNGPEITLDKDAIHHGGWEHRELHNAFGLMFHNASTLGLRARDVPTAPAAVASLEVDPHQRRPFILTRSYFAGTHRVSAMWTGDNTAEWEHLAASTPMLLTNSLAGMYFTGADVGGFFGDPSPELLARWYQVGAFQPFFRAHAHIDTKRREPWLIPKPHQDYIREAIKTRYQLLPYFYTLFYRAYSDNLPVLRPMLYEYPGDPAVLAMEDQAMVGSALLIKPITQEGQTTTTVYLPTEDVWYDYTTGDRIILSQASGWTSTATPLTRIPVYLRGGSIVPQRLRERRSSTLMKYDPITLVVALDRHAQASGELVLDDGETYGYTQGLIVHTRFQYTAEHHLRVVPMETSVQPTTQGWTTQREDLAKLAQVKVERIHLVGLTRIPQTVQYQPTATANRSPTTLRFECTARAGDTHTCIIANPPGRLSEAWEVILGF